MSIFNKKYFPILEKNVKIIWAIFYIQQQNYLLFLL
jgi:hypothetical protein